MLLASACMAALGVLVKVTAPVVGSFQVAFWRGVVSLLLVPVLVRFTGESLRPVNLRMHVARGSFGLVSMLLYFTAIDRLAYVGDAVVITFLSPMLVAGIARPILGETPRPLVWAALLLGFAGVALVVGPSGSFETWGVVAAGLSAVFAASAYVAVSMLTRTDSTASVVFWFSLWCVVWTSPSLMVGGASEVPLQLVGVGVLGTTAQWALTRAYASAPASQVAVFAYATPVFAYLLAAAQLAEVPPLQTVAGVLVVVAAGVLSTWAGARTT
jgi:drug/metabolite transporter (DMT)-like permease